MVFLLLTNSSLDVLLIKFIGLHNLTASVNVNFLQFSGTHEMLIVFATRKLAFTVHQNYIIIYIHSSKILKIKIFWSVDT